MNGMGAFYDLREATLMRSCINCGRFLGKTLIRTCGRCRGQPNNGILSAIPESVWARDSNAEIAARVNLHRESVRYYRNKNNLPPAPPRKTRNGPTLTLRVLKEYGGLPLSNIDVADETGLSVETIKQHLPKLVKQGHVRAWPNPDNPRALLYAAANKEAQ